MNTPETAKHISYKNHEREHGIIEMIAHERKNSDRYLHCSFDSDGMGIPSILKQVTKEGDIESTTRRPAKKIYVQGLLTQKIHMVNRKPCDFHGEPYYSNWRIAAGQRQPTCIIHAKKGAMHNENGPARIAIDYKSKNSPNFRKVTSEWFREGKRYSPNGEYNYMVEAYNHLNDRIKCYKKMVSNENISEEDTQ